MGILAQCPVCKTRQSIKNKLCRKCTHNLDSAKKRKQLIYWISYRLPSGKQKQEPVGTSIEETRTADGKKKTQKKEGKLFDSKADAKMTFQERRLYFSRPTAYIQHEHAEGRRTGERYHGDYRPIQHGKCLIGTTRLTWMIPDRPLKPWRSFSKMLP